MRKPTTRSGGSSFAERKRTGTSELRRSCRQRLMPSTAGMSTSRVTRSGWKSLNVSIAWRASVIAFTSWPASSRTVLTRCATSRSSPTTRIRPPKTSRRLAGAVSWSSNCNENPANAMPFVRRASRSSAKHTSQLGERCVDLDQFLCDPGPARSHVIRPGAKEEAIGLILDRLARRGALRGRLQRVRFDVAVRTETSKGGTHVLRSLVREEVGQRGFVRGFFPPRPRENLDLRSGETRGAPRRHVTVVAYLPEPVDRRVELRE